MALTSVFYDGPVTETDRAKHGAGAAEYGVYGPNDFKVTAHPSIPYAVLVKAGRAFGHGVTDIADEDQVLNCTPLSSGQMRWDLIAVRRNWQPNLGGPSTLVAIPAGGAAEIPAARKVGAGVEDDQPLFLVKWQGGTSAPVEFIDLRVWSNNNGTVAKSDLVRTYLTRVGTRVWVNGVDWIRKLGANDTPEWEGHDTSPGINGGAATDLTSVLSGWSRPFPTGPRRPRVWSADGVTAHITGVIQAGATVNANMLTIPAAFAPASGGMTYVNTVIASNGSADTVGGVVLELGIEGNTLQVVYQSKSIAVGSYVPLNGSWLING